MKLTDTLTGVGVGVVATKQNQQQTQSGQNQNGFDLLFADASRRNTIEPATDTQTQNRRDESRTRSDESRVERNHRTTRRENAQRRADDTASVNEVPDAPQDTAPIAPTEPTYTPDEVEIDEEQALEAIAAIMQVPVEVVVEMMTEQGLTAQDLLDSQAVTKLLQTALGAEDPVALLTDPAFPEQYKAINEAMAELVQEAEVAQTLVAQSTEVGAKDVQQSTTGIAYAANLEGLEVINEDGQLIVTDEAASDEVQVTTRGQSNSETSTSSEQQSQTGGQTQEGITGSNLPITDEVVLDTPQAVNPVINTDVTRAQEVQVARQAAPPTPVNVADVIEQIMGQVRVTQVGGQFTEMRMTLRPESLGDIVLRVLTQNGIVVAQFEAESQRVKEALEANFNQLRDALEEQGIQFSELSVSVRQDEEERMSQFERERQRARHRMDAINGEEITEEVQTIDPYHNGVIDITA